MSAKGSANKISKTTKQFLASWDQVRSYWRDVKSQEFEKQFIEPLPEDIAGAMRVIEEIDKILTKARRDCE